MPPPDDIRAFVIRTFDELALLPPDVDEELEAGESETTAETTSSEQPAEVSETILIRGGAYYGRSYRCGGLVATLAVETQRLEFFTQQGTLLRTIPVGEIPPRVLTQAA